MKFAKIGFGILGGLLAAWTIYAGIIRPTTKPQDTQKAESIVNYNNNPKSTFGCATTRVYVQYPVNSVK